MKIAVFEGTDEVLIGSIDSINKLVETYFLNTGRNLDDYDFYVAEADDGVLITTCVKAEIGYEPERDIDIMSLLSDKLARNLIGK